MLFVSVLCSGVGGNVFYSIENRLKCSIPPLSYRKDSLVALERRAILLRMYVHKRKPLAVFCVCVYRCLCRVSSASQYLIIWHIHTSYIHRYIDTYIYIYKSSISGGGPVTKQQRLSSLYMFPVYSST